MQDSATPLDRGIIETLERLAALERPPGSDGERTAAEILAAEFAARGARVEVEEERVHGTYWVPIGIASGLAVAAAVAPEVLGRLKGRPAAWLRRAVASAGGALAGWLIADDLEIGRRPLRRLLWHRVTRNVTAQFGPSDARRDIFVHAHHDAARTGLIFHPAIAKLGARVAGPLIERVGGTPAPMWGAVAGPICVSIGGLFGLRALRLAGAAVSAGYAAAMIDIASRRAVPGANDNLSSVCVLLALARRFDESPPQNARVTLLSTGSEESFLEAMERFGERHFAQLPRDTSVFLCIESVGSPELMPLSGEGLLRRIDYRPDLIATLSSLAAQSGVHLRDPFSYRLATDGQVPQRAGYPTAVISSMDWYKAPSNYHWPSDQPANLDLSSVAGAATLAGSFVMHLDRLAA